MRKTEHIDWFVNYTEQANKGRTTETKKFNTLKECRSFSQDKHGYIIRLSDNGSDFGRGSGSFVEFFGGFEPSAQEELNIKNIIS